jgi:thiamine-phosphate pyrophosphorylase
MHPPFDLMIISDQGPDLFARMTRALSEVPPDRVAVQLRERTLTDDAWRALAHALRTLTRARGARLLVNGPIDLALAVDADGVHLAEAGTSVREARAALGSSALIGASRHDRAGIVRAAKEGADYATLSPVHAVVGKAPPLGIDGFGVIAASAPLPIFALGGVRIADVAALRARGAHGIAVIREVLADAAPGARAAALIAALSHD